MTEAKGQITLDLKRLIGQASEPVVNEVEKGAIRKFAEAIGDPNPIWVDDAAAAQFGGIMGTPTFFTTIRAGPPPHLEFKFGRVDVATGREVEYFKPIRPGDKITAKTSLVALEEKQGRQGPMVFYTYETELTDERGERVALVRRTMARR